MLLVVEERFRRLSTHRREHIERVVAVMETLASAHDLDIGQARLAGQCHDLAREMARSELLEEAHRLGLTWGPEEGREPILLHGPIAAEWLRQSQLGNPSVWMAIQCHTTGAPGLDGIGQALFIADGVEPGRHYSGRQELFNLALRDLGAGYCAVLRSTKAYLEERGIPPHPNMLKALDDC